jgi:hypothetical protein
MGSWHTARADLYIAKIQLFAFKAQYQMLQFCQQIGHGLRTMFQMLPPIPLSKNPSLNLAASRALALIIVSIGLWQSPLITAILVLAAAFVFGK